MMSRRYVALLSLLISGVVAPLHTQQTRDAAPRPAGTAVISGTVLTAGESSAPLRAAIVTLNHVDKLYGDTAVTDDAGRYEFRQVPAGRYLVSARKAGFLTANYGATQPRRPGTPVAVADGAGVANVDVRLIRGGVLEGRVRHADGEPVPDAQVEVLRVTNVGADRRLEQAYPPGGPTTDDRGMFRFYGLAPGDYVVRVHPEPWAMMHGAMSVHAATPADMQWARAQLTGTAPSTDPPARRSRAFAPSYFPGASTALSAGVITLGPGEARDGIDIITRVVSTSRIRVSVDTDGARSDDAPELSMLEVGSSDNADSVFGLSFGHGWSYSFDGVPPGRYTVTATRDVSREWGEAEVVVSGQDVEVQVRLRPPVSVRGTLRFKGTGQAPPQGLRVALQPEAAPGALIVAPSPAEIGADGSFEVTGLRPGRYRVNPMLPASSPWSVEEIRAGQVDVTATTFTLGADGPAPALAVTLTNQPTELSGRFEDASGRPATDYTIIAFSTDERTWIRNSRAVRQTRPATDGTYSIQALPPGNYLLAAVTEVERDEWYDPGFLKELVPAGVKVRLVAGEKKTQDLRIARKPELTGRQLVASRAMRQMTRRAAEFARPSLLDEPRNVEIFLEPAGFIHDPTLPRTPEAQLEQAGCRAQAVVVGTVEDLTSFLTEDAQFILTEYTVRIEDTLLGRTIKRGSTIAYVRSGGSLNLGGKLVTARHNVFPPLAIGQKYVLFLDDIETTDMFMPIRAMVDAASLGPTARALGPDAAADLAQGIEAARLRHMIVSAQCKGEGR